MARKRFSLHKTVTLCLMAFLVQGLAACATPVHRTGQPVVQLQLQSSSEAVGLRRYAGDGARILLVGNPGISPLLFDVPGYGGLAPYLQNQGFDVWVVDWKELPLHQDLAGLTRWLNEVLVHVGQDDEVTVLAHGLGGIPAVLAHTEHVQRYVFLATPGDLGKPLDPIASLAGRVWSRPHSLSDASPRGETPAQTQGRLEALLWNFGTHPVDANKLVQLFSPLGPALLQDLSTAIDRGGWGAAFEDQLAAISVPVTVLVGQTDAVAPPWQSHELYRKASSGTKYYRFFSRALGQQREYGHLSLVLGDDAVREIYPFILRAVTLETP